MLRKLPQNILFAGIVLLVALGLLYSESRRSDLRVLGSQSNIDTRQETVYRWEQILAERPDYRDGWLQLASLYYQQGNKQKAREAVNKAKNLDPANENVLAFEKFLTD